MNTMWSLVQDEEYVFTRLAEKLDLFPALYGTCGGLYVVEELESLVEGSGLFEKELSFGSFSKRATVAMAVLDLLEELETVFDEPIHLCDIKPSHFGISDKGRVKFLDLDSIFVKSVLGRLTT